MRCSIGLMPAFMSPLYMAMNRVIKCSFFLDLIPVVRIGLLLLSSINAIYMLPFADVYKNAPV